MKIKPFKAFRPVADKAVLVASRPYDVMNSEEAREEAAGNPYSFLRVVKPEITLPADTDPYAPEVYLAGRNNFKRLVDNGTFFQEETECLYLYELTMNGRTQNGWVACAAVEDYISGKIKKHELTRPDKENDRKNHVRVAMMNAEPVFFAYKQKDILHQLALQVKQRPLIYDFKADDGIIHRLWVVAEKGLIDQVVAAFEQMPATYVADGHHRTAAAALVGYDLKKENPHHQGTEEYNYFLAVHFPDNELTILDYNRVVKDLNGLPPDAFLHELTKSFEVVPKGKEPWKPTRLHELSMYLEGSWYALEAKEEAYNDHDPIRSLDVTVLSDSVLKPLLNIHDLRTDKRIDFVGGMRGLKELQKRVDSGEMKVAFALYPVSMQQLIDIADNDLIMPPKVTWFEPKLRSGLFVHKLGE